MNEKRLEELAWMCDTKERAIAALLQCAREAAEEERERCAKVCHSYGEMMANVASDPMGCNTAQEKKAWREIHVNRANSAFACEESIRAIRRAP